SDGNIEFMGRHDHQVKVRGYRIELEEIEAILGQAPRVRACAVTAPADGSGNNYLVGYVVSEGGGSSSELRDFLHQRLPGYMVPSVFIYLESLPVTPSGKVNRRALPSPERDLANESASVAPRTATEEILVRIWKEVLHVQGIGIEVNFFEMGGYSLSATRVMTRLRQELGVEVRIRDLFAWPILADLARALESAARSTLPAIIRVDRGERLPLSYAQQRLWFLAQMEGASEAYHIPVGVRLYGRLDRRALKMALDRIVARHEPLRTTFLMVEGEPWQR